MNVNFKLAGFLVLIVIGPTVCWAGNEKVLPSTPAESNTGFEAHIESKINQSLNGDWRATVLWSPRKSATVVLSANREAGATAISYRQAEHVVRTLLPQPPKGNDHEVIQSGGRIEAPAASSAVAIFTQSLVVMTSLVIMSLSFLGVQQLWKLRDASLPAVGANTSESDQSESQNSLSLNRDAA